MALYYASVKYPLEKVSHRNYQRGSVGTLPGWRDEFCRDHSSNVSNGIIVRESLLVAERWVLCLSRLSACHWNLNKRMNQ